MLPQYAFLASQAAGFRARSGLAKDALRITNQVDAERRPASFAQYVRLLCHRVREVHRSLSVTRCPLRKLVVPPSSFDRSRVDHMARCKVDASASASATGRRVLGNTAKFSTSSRAAR